MLEAISRLGSSVQLLVCDSRSYKAAMGNRGKGGGFENTSDYRNVDIFWNDIGNIHAVRDT